MPDTHLVRAFLEPQHAALADRADGFARMDIATRAEPFATNPLVLVTAADHPFVHMEQVSALRVSMETLLFREPGSGTRAAMEDYLREHHLHACDNDQQRWWQERAPLYARIRCGGLIGHCSTTTW